MTAAALLGRAAAATTAATTPSELNARTRFLVADVLACAVSAWARPELAALRVTLLTGDGPASVIGRKHGAAPALAGLINALPVAAEQLQDGHREARGHPASHVVPAVLAAAELGDAAGPDLLAAILAGCETGILVGSAMGGTPDGVHDIGTWGTVGAAAGVAHVLSGGNASAVTAAIDLAAVTPTRPDAATVFRGATGQHLLLGLAVQSAVVAGTAAVAGLRAPDGTLERHFLPAVGRQVETAAIDDGTVAGRFGRYRLADGYVKRHPSCAHLHGVDDAVEDLLAVGPIDPARIVTIVVRTYAAAARFADPAPASDLAARFSIPASVAAAIVGGAGRLDRFRPEVLADPSFTSLARRVRVVHDPALDAGYPDGRPAVATVTMTDGTVREARSERPRGDGPDALADQAVAAKPRQLLAAAAGEAGADSVLEAIDGLGERGIAPLSGALRRLRLGRHPPLPRAADGEPARAMSASQYTSESR
jgi:2-methylcitrate dehydratase PrpD